MEYKNLYNVKKINNKINTNVKKVIADMESKYRGQLFRLVDIIAESKAKVVLLAGPSCAGKTTSARLVTEVLEKKGFTVTTISMDDFFIDREKTPLLPNGMKDFDSLNTLDLDLMKRCFTKFFTGQPTMFPTYDFKTGININESVEHTYTDKTIIVFEGLHVLNSVLIDNLGTDNVFKVFVSTMKGFEFEKYKFSPRDLRLVRRIIRDVDRRNYTVKDTIKSWVNVCDAEDKYISPFKNDADFYIDTTHEFELAVFNDAFNILVEQDRAEYDDIPNYQVLQNSVKIDKKDLPQTTLMWEFVDNPNEQQS